MDSTKLAKHEQASAPVQSSKICWDQCVESTHIGPEILREFVDMDWVCAEKTAQDEYLFEVRDIPRIRKAARLYRDFDLTVVGVTIIVDLLSRVEFLQHEVRDLRLRS
ncbi:MAG: chaperone modulator CbpM [Desulfoplanes sp.]|jgi:hypothetical protein|nr:chaperone modulator CbpM [Desulfoplanes sp.]